MTHSYQLTSHPVGSKREFWALSWPLMLGLASTSLMMFVDRVFLSYYSSQAMNGAAISGLAAYMFLILFSSVAAISEVLAGRLHGENKWKEIGVSTWQMLYFSMATFPLFILLAWLLPPLFFYQTGNEANETAYFHMIMYFGPFYCASIALTGFFMGIGRVKVVTVATIAGNLANIGLDYICIWGWGPIPEMGTGGAAFATGCSYIVQLLIFLAVFFQKELRETYGTFRMKFNQAYLTEGLTIGLPSSFGFFMELLAHFVFFRIVLTNGTDQLTIVTMVQSFSIICFFVTGAFNKTASAIVSNLLGARQFGYCNQVLKSGVIIHTGFFLALLSVVAFTPELCRALFSSPEHKQLFADPQMCHAFYWSLVLFAFHFYFDGLAWMIGGFLMAAGDTKFIFAVCVGVHWIGYIGPSIWLIGYLQGGAVLSWGLIVLLGFLICSLYVWRYVSGRWLLNFTAGQQLSSQPELSTSH